MYTKCVKFSLNACVVPSLSIQDLGTLNWTGWLQWLLSCLLEEKSVNHFRYISILFDR